MSKVMIVDDDRTTVKLLQTLLELDGFVIEIAPRGADVLPIADKFNPDIFLMDYHLSDMDGVEVLREIRAGALGGKFQDTPIIMTSGLDVEDEVMGEGATAFIVKPFDPEELPRLFNQHIKK